MWKAVLQLRLVHQGGEPCKDHSQRSFKRITPRCLGFIIYIFSSKWRQFFLTSFRCFLNLSNLVIQLTKQSNPTFDPVLSGLVCFQQHCNDKISRMSCGGKSSFTFTCLVKRTDISIRLHNLRLFSLKKKEIYSFDKRKTATGTKRTTIYLVIKWPVLNLRSWLWYWTF